MHEQLGKQKKKGCKERPTTTKGPVLLVGIKYEITSVKVWPPLHPSILPSLFFECVSCPVLSFPVLRCFVSVPLRSSVKLKVIVYDVVAVE